MGKPMSQMLLEARPPAMQRSITPPMWRLTGARVATGAATAIITDLVILNGRIHHVPAGDRLERETGQLGSPLSVQAVDLAGYLILPGLINAHDHLEFGLFPRLGRGPYQNFLEWAADIYCIHRSPVKEQLSIPKSVRLWWGAVRNLLCGVTTVSHHNPQIPCGFRAGLPVRVVTRYTWVHSPALGKNVTETFCSTPADTPFIIHAAEGVDEQSRAEIFWLDQVGALDPKTVIVHGVGMDRAGHKLLERRGSALVWCPTSNQFLLGTTLSLDSVRQHRRIALASDSALTAAGDLVDEIRFARERLQVTAEEAYAMVTNRAADVLRLARGEGTLAEGAVADLIVIADDGGRPCDSLSAMTLGRLELVMVGGKIKLLSPSLARRRFNEVSVNLERLQIDGLDRLVAAPVRNLLNAARKHLGKEIHLAGKRVGV
jgi:cytosine/adenosine deaminase-related metal-dependent hydrolase